MIPDEVAHQPHEHEIRRRSKSEAERRAELVLGVVEVLEAVEPAAREERFVRARAVASLERESEERLERNRGIRDERFGGIPAQRIARDVAERGELLS